MEMDIPDDLPRSLSALRTRAEIRASGVPRGEIFLTTKVSHEYLRADDFAKSVDESLAALKVDHVDLLMVHWPNPEIPLRETMPALAKAKRQGLARHIGVGFRPTRWWRRCTPVTATSTPPGSTAPSAPSARQRDLLERQRRRRLNTCDPSQDSERSAGMELNVPLAVMHALLLALAFGAVPLYWTSPRR
jgi:hypothetical protein